MHIYDLIISLGMDPNLVAECENIGREFYRRVQIKQESRRNTVSESKNSTDADFRPVGHVTAEDEKIRCRNVCCMQ